MTKYFKLLMVALFATLSFTLTSCGDDDDDASALVGTWEYNWTDPDDGYVYYGAVTFNDNGTFAMTETENSGSWIDTYTVTGTYTVEGNVKDGAVVTMVGTDNEGDTSTAVIIARVDGKKLHCTDDEGDTIVFTKK